MQQEFDYVADHLFKQGGLSVDSKMKCAYRSPEGKMCAVGCRIPEDMYRFAMEGLGAMQVVEQFKVPEELIEYQVMFAHLQSVHDQYVYDKDLTWNDYLNSELKLVAEMFNLEFVARK